jgi:hypothetical protein
MNGAIHPATAKQAGVGGIDDGVHRQRGDVRPANFDMAGANANGIEHSQTSVAHSQRTKQRHLSRCRANQQKYILDRRHLLGFDLVVNAPANPHHPDRQDTARIAMAFVV